MSALSRDDYYELLREAYVDYRRNYYRLAAQHWRNHTFHEFVWNAFNYLQLMEELDD